MVWRFLRSRIVIFIVAAIFLLYLGRVLVLHTEIGDGTGSSSSPAFGAQQEAVSDVANSPPSTEVTQPVKLQTCPLQLEWLEDLDGSQDLRWPLKYARRDIVVRAKPWSQHDSLLTVSESLLPKFKQLDSPFDQKVDSATCLPPLILEVPLSKKPDVSHIIFGGASNLDRIEASMPFYESWFAYTGAKMIISVVNPDGGMPDPTRMKALERRMRGLGMAVSLIPPQRKKDIFIQRYFSLVKTMYESVGEKTKWLAFVDDDTFIVSMNALVDMLAKHNHEEELYLGALSEEWWTVVAYGLIGMGGGGIFLTLPLAKIINDNFEECRDHSTKTFGDHMVFECVERFSAARLTHIDGLFQVDIHGDRSGVWESGRRIITLHHWKEGYWSEDGSGPDGIRHERWFPMDKMSLIKDVCGEDCYLQRFLFGHDTILTNGYAIASYPRGALKRMEMRLDHMEKTWVTPVYSPDTANKHVAGSANDGYEHYLCPCRPALDLEKDKIHWRFMDAQVVPGGGLRQYFRRVGREGRMDELVELFWTREALTEADMTV